MSVNLLMGGGFHVSLFGKGFDSMSDEPEEFKCSDCGATVTPDALSCPQCHATFEHEQQENFQSWSQYFEVKFSNKNHLKQDADGDIHTYRHLYVASTHEERRTYITVGLHSQNGIEVVETIHFGSGVSFSWYECYLGGQPLANDGIDILDHLLEVPLRKGWTEIDYYFLGINYKIQAILPFGNTQSRQTTIHFLGIPFWLLSLFDLLSSRKERHVSPLL